MRKLTHIEAVERVKKTLPSLTVISEYEGRFKRILVKDELGILYNALPDKLFAGKKPSLATAVNKTQGYIIKAKKIHGQKYNYSKLEYNKDNLKIKVICPLHGEFEQLATNHLLGQGCAICGTERMKLNRPDNGFSRTQWINYCKTHNKQSKLYIIHCFNTSESFIKVGITTRNVFQSKGSGRYWKTNMPYNHENLKEIIDTPDRCFDIERKIKTENKHLKFEPTIRFDGYTECFSVNIVEYLKKNKLIA